MMGWPDVPAETAGQRDLPKMAHRCLNWDSNLLNVAVSGPTGVPWGAWEGELGPWQGELITGSTSELRVPPKPTGRGRGWEIIVSSLYGKQLL